jgi:hypothetical protein
VFVANKNVSGLHKCLRFQIVFDFSPNYTPLSSITIINRSIFEKANDDQLYNTNSQRTSNMLSNVFKCFMLILLPKKHERLTYTRPLPKIKDELKC